MTGPALLTVALAGFYLVGLAAVAFAAPERARRFLAGFAGSARVHFLELALRLATGAALVAYAPQMQFSQVFGGIGWFLVGSALVLGAVPWRWHRRFAAWSVPIATRHMALLGLGSLVGGVTLLGAVLWGPGLGPWRAGLVL